jgi:molybdopterin synthase catalytic subunit
MADVLASVSAEPIDAAKLEAFVSAAEYGAVVTFRGVVRDHDHGEQVTRLDYQSHPDAGRFLEDCCQRVSDETGLPIAAAHRIGELQIGDTALVAVVAAAHRAEAFAACETLVELIKREVPIWKRQHLVDGISEWVDL